MECMSRDEHWHLGCRLPALLYELQSSDPLLRAGCEVKARGVAHDFRQEKFNEPSNFERKRPKSVSNDGQDSGRAILCYGARNILLHGFQQS
jgi:hypothetical protein